MKNKRTLVNLYKDIVLVTRVRISCMTLFTNGNNNIQVVIQINAFQTDPDSCTTLFTNNNIKVVIKINDFLTDPHRFMEYILFTP